MRYFKRFADFCTGFALFSAVIYLFREFMSTSFGEEELKITEKLKLFFDKTVELDNFMMLVLAGLLALSLAVSCVLHRFPYVSMAFAVPPLVLCFDMIKAERIEEYPLMYVILSAMGVLGAVFETLRRDREDGRCRGAVGGALVSLLTSAFCLYTWLRWREVSPISEDAVFELNFFDYEIYTCSQEMNMKSVLTFAIVYAVIAVVLLVLRDVYFIGAPLTLVPCIMLVYRWNAGSLTVHPEVIVTLSVVTAGVSLVCALSGSARSRATRAEARE